MIDKLAGEEDRGHPSGGRVGWIDSLKGILIVLLVVGHVFLPVRRDVPIVLEAFELIYLFHMPLSAFVSGLLAKRTIDAKGRLRVDRILNYLVLGFAFNLLLRLCAGSHLTVSRLLSFPSAPWYLILMATWMLLVPFFDRFRPIWGVLVALAIGTASSLMGSQTDFLALSRTAHFLPYFVLGYYVSVSSLERLRARRVSPVP